jgi:hypothetical protein
MSARCILTPKQQDFFDNRLLGGFNGIQVVTMKQKTGNETLTRQSLSGPTAAPVVLSTGGLFV